MVEFCESCALPLTAPGFKGFSERYCKYCTDTSGDLFPKEHVQSGIARWLKSWYPGITTRQAFERASCYMRAMPAWAEESTTQG